ncbi:hypothetical protein [Psychromonas sp. Urea-02u-13]|uniref:hypothetical protein n=1 Tax=Psychromonas sp. Urea-02u-13 TaxID=2058326 RepID=UPI000C31C82D|nr:hypothetical protein [Psychromonas sp. Urea-02u-13]PKG36936.1 hypothetical protein CXF74_21545 [Psychromonas sp. Urea-02u-13]
MMTLDAKVRDSGAQKGMLFTTSGFQSGAIEYAQQRGLAAVVIQPGYVKYIVNSTCDDKNIKKPILTLASEHIGYLYTINEEGYEVASTIDGLEYNPLAEFFEK